MATTQSIWQLLREAAERLDKAAREVRDLSLEPRGDHIQRIGEALTQILEIQYHLFAVQPSLTPPEMKGPFDNPESAWRIASSHAHKAEDQGHAVMAAAIFEWFAAQVGSSEHQERAKREVQRLRGRGDA